MFFGKISIIIKNKIKSLFYQEKQINFRQKRTAQFRAIQGQSEVLTLSYVYLAIATLTSVLAAWNSDFPEDLIGAS